MTAGLPIGFGVCIVALVLGFVALLVGGLIIAAADAISSIPERGAE